MLPLSDLIVSHRRLVVAGWAMAAALLLPFAAQAPERLEVGVSGIDGSEAALVERMLSARFGAPFSSYALLVAAGVPSPTERAGQAALRDIVGALEQVRGVTRTLSYLDVRDERFARPTGTFLIVGLGPGRVDEQMAELRRVSGHVQARLRQKHPGAELLWTGGAAFDYDVRLTAAADAATAEQRVLPLSLAVLLVAFGSLVAALLPVAIGFGAIGLSLGIAVLLTSHWPLTVLLQNIVSMLGLGVGIDYCLLVLSRFREALSAGQAAQRAAAAAVRSAGHTVLISAGAVAIGFAALSVIPVNELRSLAVGGLVVVSTAALLATTLLPAILAWLGPRVDLVRFRPRKASISSLAMWRGWGRWVASHPMLVLLVAGAPLVACAWQVTRLSNAIPSGSWLPESMESVRGARALERMGQSGLIQAVRVVVELPEGNSVASDEGWQCVLRVSRLLERDPRISVAQSLPLAMRSERFSPEQLVALPPDIRNSFLSRDERLALVELVPREGETLAGVMGYVRELRRGEIAARTCPAGTRTHVGGLSAYNVDYEDVVGGRVLLVVVLVVGATFAALFIGFRSLLVALKAVSLNLLTVTAAMGVVVLVFQDGHGAQWLGLAAPVDGLFPAVPILVFCVVFGLSMDYEVFLVSRVAECVRAGMPDSEALVEGVARTAGVITSAALVMVIVFAAFSLGDFLLIKILGFCLAVAVAIDATLVRVALGPALLRLGGRWNWWPGDRG